jgi:hypothetical protein
MNEDIRELYVADPNGRRLRIRYIGEEQTEYMREKYAAMGWVEILELPHGVDSVVIVSARKEVA